MIWHEKSKRQTIVNHWVSADPHPLLLGSYETIESSDDESGSYKPGIICHDCDLFPWFEFLERFGIFIPDDQGFCIEGDSGVYRGFIGYAADEEQVVCVGFGVVNLQLIDDAVKGCWFNIHIVPDHSTVIIAAQGVRCSGGGIKLLVDE